MASIIAPMGCEHADEPRARGGGIGRRRVFQLAGGSVVAALTGGAEAARPALAAGGTDALLLSCIDYRLTAATTRYMAERAMTGKYDQLNLAGAALGAKNSRFPAWAATFWDHLQLAIELHHIRRVIVMDHRDCGAYKLILGRDLAADPKAEYAVHAAQMRSLRADIHARYPALGVELLLMALDQRVEPVA